MRTNGNYNETSPRVHAVLSINLHPRVATSSNTKTGRLPPGTIIEILDGEEWIRAVVDSSGVVGVISDPLHPSCNGWQLPIAVRDDQRDFARQWRYAP